MCSTGPETIELERPAAAPAMKSWSKEGKETSGGADKPCALIVGG
jgi:hypothetical protein